MNTGKLIILLIAIALGASSAAAQQGDGSVTFTDHSNQSITISRFGTVLNQVKRLPSETTLRESIHKFLSAITDRNNPAPLEYRRHAARLSQYLLQPISTMLAGKKRLVVVADGALQRLPFEALLLPGTPVQGDLRKLPYLIRRFAIRPRRMSRKKAQRSQK